MRRRKHSRYMAGMSPISRHDVVWITGLCLWLASCGGGAFQAVEIECETDRSCPPGKVCVRGVCSLAGAIRPGPLKPKQDAGASITDAGSKDSASTPGDADSTEVSPADADQDDAPIMPSPTDASLEDLPPPEDSAASPDRDAGDSGPRDAATPDAGDAQPGDQAPDDAPIPDSGGGDLAPPDSGPAGCQRGSDCPGQYCDTLTGRCVDCLTAMDCGVGRCGQRTGQCIPPAVAPCSVDSDCPKQAPLCQSTGGIFPVFRCRECARDSECPAPLGCVDGFCVDRGSPGGQGAPCSSPSDCRKGHTCVKGANGALSCAEECLLICGNPRLQCVNMDSGVAVCK
ncbi:MAG: hypothetical protein GMKNLPBB_00289 [Myxococcota bacterium]|nr:hypothetical protein [Myxococcota bacterium]